MFERLVLEGFQSGLSLGDHTCASGKPSGAAFHHFDSDMVVAYTDADAATLKMADAGIVRATGRRSWPRSTTPPPRSSCASEGGLVEFFIGPFQPEETTAPRALSRRSPPNRRPPLP